MNTINLGMTSGAAPSMLNKLYVPVARDALIYSHFEHVSGVAASKGQGGVSISKIQILNMLIDHLASVKSGKVAPATKATSPEEIDTLIENYQTQIKQAISQNENAPYPIVGGGVIEMGRLVNLLV